MDSALRDMKSFGLGKQDIDSDGYVTLYHGGRSLPKKLNKGEIFFMTPYYDEAKDYANMRKGRVFKIKVKPEDVNWNQGSYEVEYDKGGNIVNGFLVPLIKNKVRRKKKVNHNFDDPWVGNSDFRYIKSYKNVNQGDKLPKTGWTVKNIIQYKDSNNVQFEFNKGIYNADSVISYEFGELNENVIRKIIREEIKGVMSIPPSEPINVDWEEGSVSGIVHHDREFLNNWIMKENIVAPFDSIPDKSLFPIGILKNINVDEEYQGQGYGIDLMESFLTECSHCSYVTLIADTGESQRENFNLVDWYKQFGFIIFGESSGLPVMIKRVDGTMEEIDLSINANPSAKPGIVRQFPKDNKGGHSLNLSVDDGPNEFPEEEDLK